MATLSQEDISYIRMSVGDGCEKITDIQIQYAHDAALGDECTRNFYITRWLWNSVKPAVIQLVNGGTGFSTAVLDAYEKRMNEWRNCAGKGNATLTVGVLNQNLDTVPDDLDNPDASWLYPE